MVLYQDITTQAGEILNNLSNTELPTLMAMIFVLLATSVPLFAIALIAWMMQKPKSKEKSEEVKDKIDVLFFEQIVNISTDIRDATKAIARITEATEQNGINWTSEHNQMIETMQAIQTPLLTVVNSSDEIRESVGKLSQDLETYTNKVNEAGKGIMDSLSPLDQTLMDIRTELKELRESINRHLAELGKLRKDIDNQYKKTEELQDEFTDTTKSIEQRLSQVEMTAKEMQKTETEDNQETKSNEG